MSNWKDRSTVVVRDGLHMERYALENGQLKKVEDKTADVGKRIHAITTESLLLNSSGDYEERETMFDIDDDGEYEILTFSHDTSHPYDFGAAMCLEKIRWSDGKETADSVFSDLHGGSTFEFLEKKRMVFMTSSFSVATSIIRNGTSGDVEKKDVFCFLKKPERRKQVSIMIKQIISSF